MASAGKAEKQLDANQNRLLAKLPADELDMLRTGMERVSLGLGFPIITPHMTIEHAYFPINCLASLVTVLEDGSTVEGGSVGREGMTGIPIILGAGSTPMQTVIQVAGDAIRVPAAVIKRAFDHGRMLHVLLNRYVHTLFVVSTQSSACNRRHRIEARLARWLLMSSDGIGSDTVGITQEYLAAMLGVRRSGVTEAALKLQDAGMIRYTRGSVDIIDRTMLEATACECYRMVKNEYERLLL